MAGEHRTAKKRHHFITAFHQWAPGPVQRLQAFPCSSLISRGHFGKKKNVLEGQKHAELSPPLSNKLCGVLLFELCAILLRNVSSKQSLCTVGTAAELCGKCTDKRSIFLVRHSVAQDKCGGRASGLVIDVVFNAFFFCVRVCVPCCCQRDCNQSAGLHPHETGGPLSLSLRSVHTCGSLYQSHAFTFLPVQIKQLKK